MATDSNILLAIIDGFNTLLPHLAYRVDANVAQVPNTECVVISPGAEMPHDIWTTFTYQLQISVYTFDMRSCADTAQTIYDTLSGQFAEPDGFWRAWNLSGWRSVKTVIHAPLYLGKFGGDQQTSKPLWKYILRLDLVMQKTA